MAIYTITANGETVYDSRNALAYPVRDPGCDLGINDAGTMEFTVIPGHPFYNQLTKMRTFITAYRDDREIFYGRILSTSKDINGLLVVTCEGALTFFLDSDVPPGTYNETVSAFLSRCIASHNAIVEEEKRFTLGTVTTERAVNAGTVRFELNDYTQTKSVLDNMLSSRYGGHFRVRPNPNGPHFLDYIESYDRVNTQPIKIAENVVDRTDDISGETMFTILRPIGDDGLTLESLIQSNVSIPGVVISGTTLRITDLIEKYGNILRTETFSDATDKAKLLSRAEDYITRHGSGPSSSCKIGFVDWSHLNPDVMDVRIGDTFTAIEGFADQVMTVSEQHLEFSNPGDDSITLKNPAELAMELSPDGPSSASGAAGAGGLSSMTNNQANNSEAISKLYKYIQEGEKLLQLHTDDIQITSEKTLQLSTAIANITAGQMYLIAEEMPDPDNPGQMLPGEIQLVAREVTADGDIRTTLTVSLGNVSVTNGDFTVSGYMKAQDIEAEGYVKGRDVEAMGYVKAAEVAAEYAKITEVESEFASIRRLMADYITADEVEATYATISDLNAMEAFLYNGQFTHIHADDGQFGELTVNGQTLMSQSTISMGSVASADFWGSDDLSLAHSHAITATASGGVVTITMGAEQATGGTANFNIADTQFYIDGISAAKASMGLSRSLNVISVAEGGASSYTVEADNSLTYYSADHIYRTVATATVNGTTVSSRTLDSGTEAYDAGKAAMGLSMNGNQISVVEGGSSGYYAVYSYASVGYNPSTHTYTAYSTAEIGTTVLHQSSDTSGTEAYDAGYQDAQSSMPTYTRIPFPLYYQNIGGGYTQFPEDAYRLN